MKFFLRILLAIALTVPLAFAGYYLARDPGQLIIGWFNTEIETTLVAAAVFIVIALLLLSILLWLLRLPWLLSERRAMQLRRRFLRGLTAHLSGAHRSARDELVKASVLTVQRDLALYFAAKSSDVGGLRGAATLRAKVDDSSPIKDLLDLDELAAKASEGDAVAVNALVQRGNAKDASPHALRLAFDVLRERGRADVALQLIQRLKQAKAGAEPELARAYAECVTDALAHVATAEELEKVWAQVSADDRAQLPICRAFVQAAIRLGAHSAANEALDAGLASNGSEQLYALFADAAAHDQLDARLKKARRYLERDGESAMLLLAIGKLEMRLGRLDAGRTRIKSALSLGATARAYAALGDLEREQGNLAAAAQAYGDALALVKLE